MTHRVALLLSTLLLGVGPVSAQQGITSLGPDWSPEPKTYATTAALFADSLAVSWDGTKAVEVRLRVADVVNGKVERFLTGRSFTLEPGSTRIVLQSLLPAGMIGRSAAVLGWAQAARMISGRAMAPEGWEDDLVATLFSDDFSVDWSKESLLLLALTAAEERDLREVDVMPLLVARPRPLLEPDQR
jgi:hypothetical protein